MTIAELRKNLGLTLEEFAKLLGLKSKGQASEIEGGAKCSARVALEIERLSEGQIDAGSLSADVALVRNTPTPQADAAA